MTKTDLSSHSVSELQNQIQLCMMQRQNMEAIFNAVADGIIAFDLHLRIINLNKAAQAMIGYTREEAVGESCLELLPATANRDTFCALFNPRREIDASTTHLDNRHGRTLQVLVSTRILKDDEDHVQGLVAILRDVTELETLREKLQHQESFFDLIGKSHRMQGLYQLVEDLAESNASVLILGESGTGKELVATAIHNTSQRSEGPLVKVNCSALSEGLLESELFGHVKGAFTGAIRDKAGRFEQADGGTVFLDEIGDLSSAVQVKLLRVLQEREIERVGSNEPRKVDVRIISATNQNLEEKINNNYPAQNYLKERWEVKGEFKHDLLNQYNQKGGSAIKNTHARTRTWNLRLRRATPYPLGHAGFLTPI